jgi:UDP-N-acetylglucosamine 2-epimerase (non-hydrolysing)
MKIIWVAGARPNFMKVAAIWRAMEKHNAERTDERPLFEPLLVHTGQHYDTDMSEVFFSDLDLPVPNYSLGVGSGMHGEQTARILTEFERVLQLERPQVVGVVGDVNSSIACALATAKSYVLPGGRAPLLAHVEAGLRSRDRRMPEEINRIVVDALSDLLFTPEQSGTENLLAEGVGRERIHHVGNVMVDSLLAGLPKSLNQEQFKEWGLLSASGELRQFGLVTLHRPSNVDDDEMLTRLLAALEQIGDTVPIIFPVHPRTRVRMERLETGKLQRGASKTRDGVGLRMHGPLGYTDFLSLLQKAAFVITDSGGVQAETTALRVPCLTLRENTEWPITVAAGSNTLLGRDPDRIAHEVREVLAGRTKRAAIPPLWDGHAAERVIGVLSRIGSGLT